MTLRTATRPKPLRKRPRSPFQRDIDQRLARIEASLERHTKSVGTLRSRLEDVLERMVLLPGDGGVGLPPADSPDPDAPVDRKGERR